MQANTFIRGQLGQGVLDKVDRLFRNDDQSTWVEILQNARRAGATRVDVEIQKEGDHCLVTVHDDGSGIEDFQGLLTLGNSGWSEETQQREDPAGMGFFALCRSEVEVQSGNHRVKLSPEVFLGKSEAEVQPNDIYVRGTRIQFTRASSKEALTYALERVSEFCPVEIRLAGITLERHDFLEGALHRKWIDGIEVGFATEFKWQYSYDDANWNFYGLIIRHSFPAFPGFLLEKIARPFSLHVRFNVLETAHVKLQLPDRRGIIEDEYLKAFFRKASAAAYRFFQTQTKHALPFRNFEEAKQLGVTLPETVPLLTTWHAQSADSNIEPVFGSRETKIATDISRVLLVDNDLANAHTFEAAIVCGAERNADLYEEQREYEGYTWYDALPRVVDAEVLLDGIPYEEASTGNGRPEKIEVALTIEQAGIPSRSELLPTFVHVNSDFSGDLEFVAVRQSPWDNDNLDGRFSIHEFLVAATFSAGDDCDCDSWDTQRDTYDEFVRREVNEYFRGPKASLLAILGNSLDWEANRLANKLGITEIRFRRTQLEQGHWDVEVIS